MQPERRRGKQKTKIIQDNIPSSLVNAKGVKLDKTHLQKKSKQPETTANLDTAMWQTTVKAAIGSTRFICSWQEAQHVYQNVLFVGQAQSLSINNLEMSSNSKRALGLLDPLGLWHPLHPWHSWHPRHPSLAEALRSLAVGGCARPSAAFCKPWNNLARCSTLWHIA